MSYPAHIDGLGPEPTAWLAEVGIDNLSELRVRGSVQAFRGIRERHPSVDLRLLYELEASLWGVASDELPRPVKQELERAARGDSK